MNEQREAAIEPEIKVTIKTLSEVSKRLLRSIEALGPGIIWDSKNPKQSFCTAGALKDLVEELKSYSGYAAALEPEKDENGLLPCPICGGKANKHPRSISYGMLSQVECEKRCISTMYRRDAVEVWNRRTK